MTMYARLKPQVPQLGYLMATCNYQGLHFDAGGMPREVSPEQAAFLRAYREEETRSTSPLAFDVWEGALDDAPPTENVVEASSTPGPITTGSLRSDMIPRSKVDFMIAQAVRQALAERDAAAQPSPPPVVERAPETAPPELPDAVAPLPNPTGDPAADALAQQNLAALNAKFGPPRHRKK